MMTTGDSVSSFGYSEKTGDAVASFGYLGDLDDPIQARYYYVLRQMYGKLDKLFYSDRNNYDKWQKFRGIVFDKLDKIIEDIKKTYIFPTTCISGGNLEFWEELTGAKRFYEETRTYDDEYKRKMITAILRLTAGNTRTDFENLFITFGYEISYYAIDDTSNTVRFEEGGDMVPFRVDFSVIGDAIIDNTNSCHPLLVRIYSKGDEPLNIMRLVNMIKCEGTSFIWIKL